MRDYCDRLINSWLKKLLDCQIGSRLRTHANEARIEGSLEYARYLCQLPEWTKEVGANLLFVPTNSRVKLVTGNLALHERKRQKIPLTKRYFDSDFRVELEHLLVFQKLRHDAPAILGWIDRDRLRALIDNGDDELGNYSVRITIDDFGGHYQMTDTVLPITDDLNEKWQQREDEREAIQRKQDRLISDHTAKSKPISLGLLQNHLMLYVRRKRGIPDFVRGSGSGCSERC